MFTDREKQKATAQGGALLTVIFRRGKEKATTKKAREYSQGLFAVYRPINTIVAKANSKERTAKAGVLSGILKQRVSV